MTTISEKEMDAKTLNYLIEREKEIGKDEFYKLTIFGFKARDIIKLLERHNDCKRWPEYFIDDTISAIEKIYQHCILKDPLEL